MCSLRRRLLMDTLSCIPNLLLCSWSLDANVMQGGFALTRSEKSTLMGLMNANKCGLMECHPLLTVIKICISQLHFWEPSLGSQNDWNGLAVFKASSSHPQMCSSHIWFISPLTHFPPPRLSENLSVLKHKAQKQMVDLWTSLTTLIFSSLSCLIWHPITSSNP